jgi:hypothetical protein
MAATIADQFKLVAQLGLLEGIKAGLLQPTTAQAAAIAALATVTTANATDLPTAQALANANKVAINAIIAALKTA